mmetsp:Transcript_49500/g.141924  ORF Transcript_49500/g.141924 Transcript_49500/m.141924 type:complete len:346 (+) Transcript_49500:479-1516(+)
MRPKSAALSGHSKPTSRACRRCSSVSSCLSKATPSSTSPAEAPLATIRAASAARTPKAPDSTAACGGNGRTSLAGGSVAGASSSLKTDASSPCAQFTSDRAPRAVGSRNTSRSADRRAASNRAVGVPKAELEEGDAAAAKPNSANETAKIRAALPRSPGSDGRTGRKFKAGTEMRLLSLDNRTKQRPSPPGAESTVARSPFLASSDRPSSETSTPGTKLSVCRAGRCPDWPASAASCFLISSLRLLNSSSPPSPSPSHTSSPGPPNRGSKGRSKASASKHSSGGCSGQAASASSTTSNNAFLRLSSTWTHSWSRSSRSLVAGPRSELRPSRSHGPFRSTPLTNWP